MDASSSTPEAGFLTIGEVCQEFEFGRQKLEPTPIK